MATVLLEHVAKKAKVSKATASVVLNNKSSQMRISETTKKRVIQVARDLRYHPNFAARLMAKQRTSMIGLVIHNINSEFCHSIISTLQTELAKHKDSIVLGYSEGDVANEAGQLDTLVMKRMDGIIVSPVFGNEVCPEPIRRYMEEGKPVVTVIRKWRDPEVPYVVFDEVYAGYLATKHLLELGHRKIGIIHSGRIEWGKPAGCSLSHDRYFGYQKAFREAGLDSPDLTRYEPDEQLVEKLKDDEVTAVMCMEDSTSTIRIMKDFARRGVSVPGDISVIGFGERIPAQLATPALTIIARPDCAGAVVADTLFDLMNGKKVEGKVLKPELVEGESCGTAGNRE